MHNRGDGLPRGVFFTAYRGGCVGHRGPQTRTIQRQSTRERSLTPAVSVKPPNSHFGHRDARRGAPQCGTARALSPSGGAGPSAPAPRHPGVRSTTARRAGVKNGMSRWAAHVAIAGNAPRPGLGQCRVRCASRCATCGSTPCLAAFHAADLVGVPIPVSIISRRLQP